MFRVRSQSARLALTNNWEVIRDGLAALIEVHALEAGQRIAEKSPFPTKVDDRYIIKSTSEVATSYLRDYLEILAQDLLPNDLRADH